MHDSDTHPVERTMNVKSAADRENRATILIVDDISVNLIVLGEILRGAGYRLQMADCGRSALEFAQSAQPPDLILLDVLMPDMDGYQVLEQLKGNPVTRSIPVVFITASNALESEIRGLSAGAADFLAKPVVPQLVLARVRAQLELKHARDLLCDHNAYLEAEVARRVAEVRTIQHESEHAKSRLRHRLDLILSCAGEGICGVDCEGVISFANPAAEATLGYSPGELLGQNFFRLVLDDGHAASPLRAAVEAGCELRNHECTFHGKKGQQVPVNCFCAPLREDAKLLGAVIAGQDITDRRNYLQQLENKSNYDDLTGLPNRNLLNDRLTRAVGRCCQEQRPLSVLVVSPDRFKGINDSLGREVADAVLVAIVQRLTRLLEPGDTLARLEGEEFVLVSEVHDAESIGRFARMTVDMFSMPLLILGRELVIPVSIGIAHYPKDGDTCDELLRNASIAMFRAEIEGGCGFRYYTPEMNARALERLSMEVELRRAIDGEGLILHYQPQLELHTGRIVGVEALVRWMHPRKGWVMPGEFIALAEECGLIIPLGEWVLRQACEQHRIWRNAGLPSIRMAVNISARQLVGSDLVALTAAVLEDTGMPAQLLELELTESAALPDMQAFIATTEHLKALGVKLSIDDFGTGFSSLSYLRYFPIDRLKIDRSFISDVVQDEGSVAIVNSIITLARSLDLTALAEGVESAEQVAFLRARRCEEMQGFFFSRAVVAEEIEVMLRTDQRLPLGDEPWGCPAAKLCLGCE